MGVDSRIDRFLPELDRDFVRDEFTPTRVFEKGFAHFGAGIDRAKDVAAGSMIKARVDQKGCKFCISWEHFIYTAIAVVSTTAETRYAEAAKLTLPRPMDRHSPVDRPDQNARFHQSVQKSCNPGRGRRSFPAKI